MYTLLCWPSGRASASRAADLGLIPAFPHVAFYRSCHASELRNVTPVANLPVTWHYWVDVGTGWPPVRVLCLGEIACLICKFCLSLAVHTRSGSDHEKH